MKELIFICFVLVLNFNNKLKSNMRISHTKFHVNYVLQRNRTRSLWSQFTVIFSYNSNAVTINQSNFVNLLLEKIYTLNLNR